MGVRERGGERQQGERERGIGPGTNCLKIHLNLFSFFPTFVPYISHKSP